MVDAFATYTDLGVRLNRTFTTGEQPWITQLLKDASTYLRGVIGQQVYPQQQVTFTGYPSAGRVDLPQFPVISVDSVTRSAVDIDYEYRPGYVLVDGDTACDIQFTFGVLTAPDELVRITCVLVSQALLTLEQNIGLTAGGLSSVALDDFKLAWADAGAQSGMVLTPHAEVAVREQFGGASSFVVETGR